MIVVVRSPSPSSAHAPTGPPTLRNLPSVIYRPRVHYNIYISIAFYVRLSRKPRVRTRTCTRSVCKRRSSRVIREINTSLFHVFTRAYVVRRYAGRRENERRRRAREPFASNPFEPDERDIGVFGSSSERPSDVPRTWNVPYTTAFTIHSSIMLTIIRDI